MKITKFKDPHTHRFKWKADFTCANTRHYPVADTTSELYDQIDAIKRRARRIKYGLPDEYDDTTIGELVAAKKKALNLKDRVHRRRLKRIESFRDHLGENYIVCRIETADITAWKILRWSENPKIQKSSMNTELGTIGALLHSAPYFFKSLKDWHCPKIPYEKVNRKKRRRVPSIEETNRLIDTLRRPRDEKGELMVSVITRLTVADILEVALNTAMRGGEVRKLVKDSLDFEAGLIKLTETKTDDDRTIPMNSRVREILMRAASASPSKWVFTNGAGTGPLTQFYPVVKRAALKAKLPYGQFEKDGFTPHTTRHIATTRMLHRGHDIATVQGITGHSDSTMILVYGKATSLSLRMAVESLGDGSNGHSSAKNPLEEDAPTP